MEIFKTIAFLKKRVSELKTQGKLIGFVPTMGNLHAGHVSLVDAARLNSDYVITSIFVNPTQFGKNEDFSKYPRTFEEDIKKLKNTDAVFFPSIEELYPKEVLLFISESKISKVLCGKFRQNHFEGVLTIVNKLFNIINPDFAYFGEKDYQQLKLIEKMVFDLNMNLKIISCPIVREASGLAMSSRNNYLSLEGRKKAANIYKALNEAKTAFNDGVKDMFKLKELVLKTLNSDFKIQYIEILDTETFNTPLVIKPGSRIFVCAYLEGVRLIDNLVL